MEKVKKGKNTLLAERKHAATKYAHATRVEVRAQEIHTSFCDTKGCRFYGERAVQGVCFTTPALLAEYRRDQGIEREAREHLAWIKKHGGRGRKYVSYLEGEVFVMTMNSRSMMDELVLLRRKVALLEDDLAKAQKKSKLTFVRRSR